MLTCYGTVDKEGLRYLLGDSSGRLFMLFLETKTVSNSDGFIEVKDLKVELLGEVNN